MNLDWNSYVFRNYQLLNDVQDQDLDNILSILRRTRDQNGILWVLGNGGSASLAAHAVADFSKSVSGLGGKPLKTVAPSEMSALQTAFSNDESFELGFSRTLSMYASPKDAVLVISVSGTSPNLTEAIKNAKAMKMPIGAIVGSKGSALRDKVDALVLLQSTDYQDVENAQVAVMHWLTKALSQIAN